MPTGARQDPHELLRDLRRFIGRRSGDAVLLGEVNLAPDAAARVLRRRGRRRAAAWSSSSPSTRPCTSRSRASDATPLARALRGAPADPRGLPVGELRAQPRRAHARQAERGRARRRCSPPSGRTRSMQLYGRGLRRRLPTMLGGDERRIRMVVLARVLAARHAGAVLRRGDRDGREPRDRGPLQRARRRCSGRREPQAGFTTADEAVPAARRGGPVRLPRGQRRRASGATRDSLLNWMERLIRRRRECPELGWGTWTLLDTGDAAVFAHRCDWEDSTVVAVHNLAGREASAHLVLGGEGELVDLFEDEDHDLEAGELTLELDPYGAPLVQVAPARRAAAALAGQLLDRGEVEVAVVGAEALRDQRGGGAAEPRGGRGGRGRARARAGSRRRRRRRSRWCRPTSTSNAGTRSAPLGVDDQHAVGAAGGGHAAHAALEQRPAAGLEVVRAGERRAPARRSAAGSRARASAGAIQSSRPGSPGASTSAEVTTPCSRARARDRRGRLAAHELRARRGAGAWPPRSRPQAASSGP